MAPDVDGGTSFCRDFTDCAEAWRIGVVPEGARLVVVGEDTQADGRTWRNVRTTAGAVGWVATEHVRDE